MTPTRPNRRSSSTACRRAPVALVLLLSSAAFALPGLVVSASVVRSSGGRGLLKSSYGPCLCVFDNDRTLTGKQGTGMALSGGDNSCPADIGVNGAYDKAYGKGELTLSELAQQMRSTWCGEKCYLGIISAGDAPTGKEAMQVAAQLSRDYGNKKMPASKSLGWADATTASLAPFLYKASPTMKYTQVPKIVAYYKKAAGVAIADHQVFFFDDIAENVNDWRKSKYNARQVSCRSRDTSGSKDLGRCGATVFEINALKFSTGCSLCKGACK